MGTEQILHLFFDKYELFINKEIPLICLVNFLDCCKYLLEGHNIFIEIQGVYMRKYFFFNIQITNYV